ncbi:Uncharacterised protein [Candidatus Tiddalikarchaeum anstoanum]|nr:Uncharacterised protein [Candidatus Tiddalikarchaeum anstoanum]
MAYLSDYDRNIIFNDFKQIESIDRTIIKGDKEPFVIRLLIVPGSDEKVAHFFLSPKSEALTFKNNFFLNNNAETFNISVLGFLLPDSWSGELNMVVDGFAKKIPLHFEKRSLLF